MTRKTPGAFQPAPVKATASIDGLSALDIRLGTIESVTSVPDADRLVVMRVNLGDRMCSVVAGIKQERDDPGEIAGRQALFVGNLPPRRIRGIMSEGMLLDIGYQDGLVPALAVPERPLPNGARAG